MLALFWNTCNMLRYNISSVKWQPCSIERRPNTGAGVCRNWWYKYICKYLYLSYLVHVLHCCHDNLWGLSRYSLYTTATLDPFWNDTKKHWKYSDEILLVSTYFKGSVFYKKQSDQPTNIYKALVWACITIFNFF